MNDFDKGYFYDWTCEPPCTTDPKYDGKLERGEHQRVLLNGEDMGDVRKCVTGGKGVGWVEKNIRDKEGYIVYPEYGGEIATERSYGEVRYLSDG